MSAIPVLRSTMQPVGRSVRAFFAPVSRPASQPTIFDPAAAFDMDTPPAPWIALGEVSNLARTSETKTEAIRAGKMGAIAGQCRSQLDARVAFEFRDWGKVQMALAGGSQHMNILEPGSGSPAPCGGPARPAVAVQAGSSAAEIVLDAAGLARFSPGDLIAVDRNYQGQTGWLGAGIAAVFVPANDGIVRDQDFLRRMTFNVSRVSSKTSTSLRLAQPLPGGIPSGTVGVQKVVGFVDREGGLFFHEWSALFILPEDSGGRLCFYYPRLQSIAGAAEGERTLSAPLSARTLRAVFRALPFTDALDGERVLCYRSYFPLRSAAAF